MALVMPEYWKDELQSSSTWSGIWTEDHTHLSIGEVETCAWKWKFHVVRFRARSFCIFDFVINFVVKQIPLTSSIFGGNERAISQNDRDIREPTGFQLGPVYKQLPFLEWNQHHYSRLWQRSSFDGAGPCQTVRRVDDFRRLILTVRSTQPSTVNWSVIRGMQIRIAKRDWNRTVMVVWCGTLRLIDRPATGTLLYRWRRLQSNLSKKQPAAWQPAQQGKFWQKQELLHR